MGVIGKGRIRGTEQRACRRAALGGRVFPLSAGESIWPRRRTSQRFGGERNLNRW